MMSLALQRTPPAWRLMRCGTALRPPARSKLGTSLSLRCSVTSVVPRTDVYPTRHMPERIRLARCSIGDVQLPEATLRNDLPRLDQSNGDESTWV
jgi:hypothetical protein